MKDGLYRIVLPYAVCGVLVKDGLIVVAAPIVKWSLGKNAETLFVWVRGKGGKVQCLEKSE